MSKDTIETLEFCMFIMSLYNFVILMMTFIITLIDIDRSSFKSAMSSIKRLFKDKDKILIFTFIIPIMFTFISIIIYLQLNNEQFIDNLLFNLTH